MSKRDKKRQLLNDKLSNLNEQWNRDRDRIYREQLQKIQVDTNLVMRVDPYEERPLDIIEAEERELAQAGGSDADRRSRAGTRSLLDMAGPTFQEWKHNAEDLLEERDFQLTKHKVSVIWAWLDVEKCYLRTGANSEQLDYDRKYQEYLNTHAFKVELARREHKALANTLRDRLINVVTAKKYRLNKEKEALEISDSSALLLHPSQFSITNPSSPGTNQGKRTTRLRRDAEDVSGFSDSKKRKRNAGDDDGSPAPARRGVDASNTTPLWHTDRTKSKNQSTTIYSIDKLFTERELSMTYNAAALAAHKYILSHPKNGADNGGGSPKDTDSSNEEANGEDGDHDDAKSPPSSQMMERQPSHATRSTRGGAHNQSFVDDKVLGLVALGQLDLPANWDKIVAQEPKLPPLIPTQYAKPYSKSAEQNTPAGLANEDASADMAIMALFRQYEQVHGVGSNFDIPNGGRRLLEEMAYTPKDNRYVAYLQGPRPDPQKLQEELRLAAESGSNTGVPMSRQSSLGGVAMSRQGTGSSLRGGRGRRA